MNICSTAYRQEMHWDLVKILEFVICINVILFLFLSQPCKFLIETIFAKGMTVWESKQLILPEIKEKCGLDIPIER